MVAMPTQMPTRRLSWEEYLLLDKERYEIIDGEVREMATPTLRHQNVLSELLTALRSFAKQNQAGMVYPAPYDVVIQRSPLRTRQPDLFFFSRQQLLQAPHLLSEPRTEIAPELVIEVLSPSDSVSVWRDKLHDYHQVGVREVWAVDLENEEIEVLVRESWGYRALGWFRGETPIISQVLPQLTLTPKDLFVWDSAPSTPE